MPGIVGDIPFRKIRARAAHLCFTGNREWAAVVGVELLAFTAGGTASGDFQRGCSLGAVRVGYGTGK